MLSIFARMSTGILAAIGEDSTLRSDVPCRVNIEHGVKFTGAMPMAGSHFVAHDDPMLYDRSVATILKSLVPKVGDQLTHPDGVYILDAELGDNGYTQQFILRKA